MCLVKKAYACKKNAYLYTKKRLPSAGASGRREKRKEYGMKELLLTRPFRAYDIERFADIPEVHVTFAEEPTDDELIKAEIIMGQPRKSALKKAVNAKWLQITSAGSDHYTAYPELFENGLMLTNLSGAFGQSISEFVLTMALMLYKKLPLYRDNQNLCLWKDEGVQDSPVGKNLLILGAGNIGTEIAKLFRPFRCHITGMRRTVREIPAEFDAMITMEGLDEALKSADIIACALPESPETHKLIDAGRIALMKEDAILINVGRGGLIDTDALTEALKNGHLWGAALDVTDPEPLPADHPLWKERRCIVTPHITGGSFGHLKATEETLFSICLENLKRYLNNEPLLNVVDIKTGYRQTDNRY